EPVRGPGAVGVACGTFRTWREVERDVGRIARTPTVWLCRRGSASEPRGETSLYERRDLHSRNDLLGKFCVDIFLRLEVVLPRLGIPNFDFGAGSDDGELAIET